MIAGFPTEIGRDKNYCQAWCMNGKLLSFGLFFFFFFWCETTKPPQQHLWNSIYLHFPGWSCFNWDWVLLYCPSIPWLIGSSCQPFKKPGLASMHHSGWLTFPFVSYGILIFPERFRRVACQPSTPTDSDFLLCPIRAPHLPRIASEFFFELH